MELRIKPFPKNSYPKKGVLIKGTSPLVWLCEMETLGVNLDQVRTFPVPSREPNVLYGCFLIFQDAAPREIGRNAYFQEVGNKLFIPENTVFYPKVNPEEWQHIDAEYVIMHPDFGWVKLNEEIDWLSVIQSPKPSGAKIRKPLNGVKIPQHITSYTVEIDDQQILENLQQPQTEEEWMKNLPFDLKKVMAGNKKEVEKYLQYIEKYPERALDLGVPLDTLGTSRGDGFGIFRFKNSWLEKLFGKKQEGGSDGKYSGRNYGWVFWTVLLMIGLARVFIHFNRDKPEELSEISSGKVQTAEKPMMKPVVAYQSGVTDIDMKIDSMYGAKRRKLMKEHLNASLKYSKPGEKEYQEYLKNGGRPIGKIQEDIFKLNDETNAATDSLRRVYRKKIVNYLAQNEELEKTKIKDSLKKTGSGKLADEGVVKTILKKRAILIEDSLGRLYGTKELPPPTIDPSQAIKAETFEKDAVHTTSVAEIFWLIVAMTGAVGLYSFFIKRKALNVGGENVPGGTKIFLMGILIAMLAYIFYPLIETYGYNWFVWLLIIGVILLLYRLFSEDKTILKSDKNE
ncbi:APC family permease [uncultured Chryseobacterium sp.]|uniref:APC family permease n=1 Tax=uncultured Chryseobacterium sp. TaxID=259322 RepID=UPI0025F946F5|nr:APC family permease [uncultured Chryseobacterium sp.]